MPGLGGSGSDFLVSLIAALGRFVSVLKDCLVITSRRRVVSRSRRREAAQGGSSRLLGVIEPKASRLMLHKLKEPLTERAFNGRGGATWRGRAPTRSGGFKPARLPAPAPGQGERVLTSEGGGPAIAGSPLQPGGDAAGGVRRAAHRTL